MSDVPERGSLPELAQAVGALQPWVTKFRVWGREFGGDAGGGYEAMGDERIARLPVFVPRARRILECGCLEGGHTALLGRLYPLAEVVALDVREANLAKARLLTGVAGVRPPRFVCRDLETAEVADLGRFDLVVCVGLLYHLREPWRCLARLGAVTDCLWLWTLVCPEAQAGVTAGPWRGRRFVEGPQDSPLSAVRAESFFPTLDSLCGMVRAAGFADLHLMAFEDTPNGPALLLHATKEPFRTG